MPDPEHEIELYIMWANALLGQLRDIGQDMSVSSSTNRAKLFPRCLPILAELRRLAQDEFPSKIAFVLPRIDDLEQALLELTTLKVGTIVEDRRNGTGPCPACGGDLWFDVTPISDDVPISFHENVIACQTCCKPVVRTIRKLQSPRAFDVRMAIC